MEGGIDISAFSYVDLAALGILVLMGVRGLIKGFVWQVAGIVTLLGGLVLARYIAPSARSLVAVVLPDSMAGSNVDLYVAYFVIFVLVMVVVAILARLLRNVIGALKLQSYDRLLGGLLGLVLGAIIVLVVVLGLSYIKSDGLEQAMAKAYTPRYAEAVVGELDPLFPDEVQAKLHGYIEKIRQHIPGADMVIEGGQEGAPGAKGSSGDNGGDNGGDK